MTPVANLGYISEADELASEADELASPLLASPSLARGVDESSSSGPGEIGLSVAEGGIREADPP